MGGLFGCVSENDCLSDLFYGTDYHSHLGTKRGGLAVLNSQDFSRSIHNIENDYFRSKFESDLSKLHGHKGIGIISDHDPQPLIIGSHLGTFAIVTVSKINNIEALAAKAFHSKHHFSEMSGGETSPTELVAMLISEAESFEAGIQHAQEAIQGSCSLLLLTQSGIYAARDKLGRTPVVIGKKEGAFAAASESCAFPNLGYNTEKNLGPGEIVFITADGIEQRKPPQDQMQVCAFLWVYYGYPATSYEGINVEATRNRCGRLLA
ncbi:MAG: amidophosphoribosyltransferase, partial [Desulfobacterales bacterium]